MYKLALGGERYVKKYHITFFVFIYITILSRFFVMLVLLFCLSNAAKLISLLKRQSISR